MWVTIDAIRRVGDADMLEHLNRVRTRLLSGVTKVQLRHFHQLPGHAHERIERSHRVLKNHGQALAAQLANLARREFQNVAPVKQD